MREDAATPLLIACGGGLTDLASACRIEPEIAKRIRLVWIGGPEHDGIATPPPGAQAVEYNLGTNPQGRPMRVYTQLDTRLLFEDFHAKIARFDRGANSNR